MGNGQDAASRRACHDGRRAGALSVCGDMTRSDQIVWCRAMSMPLELARRLSHVSVRTLVCAVRLVVRRVSMIPIVAAGCNQQEGKELYFVSFQHAVYCLG